MIPMASDSISTQASAAVLAVPQPVSSPLTNAAIFLVVTINPSDENRALVLSLCADLSALLRAVGFRDVGAIDPEVSGLEALGAARGNRHTRGGVVWQQEASQSG